MDNEPRQRIRYLRTRDGVQLAWAEAGAGPLLVKAANWLTHLEFEWESPVWSHWIRFFSRHFRFVRYDERGCGMTDWDVAEVSLERWVDDLDQVVEAAAPREPLALLGISHGAAACLGYAVRHPERVSRMILYGGYARGYSHRGDPEAAREYRAILDLFEIGWGKENPAFQQVFTSRFIPGGTPEQLSWFNDLCRKTLAPAMAGRLLEMRGALNAVDLLEQVRVPTLVIHARQDAVVPLAEGRLMASAIPGAQFVELESKNHILLESEPAWTRFQEVALEFLGVPAAPAGEDAAFASLSPREREVLALISEGLANAEIGERLSISEKTVRNHISNLFDKLGVWTRAQAMVFARDRGFVP
ncbi:MAG TPA: alpha/beta fold hydrolase [Thermoanaerobaculia bacterium]|jgi:pimeloyl-ACP methyl ester carboxylesterase/DNA-binding CsgD family transcriptional regulator|nr:alpha/beta fold hydrolase [Thermoanaerobaculia bacterium]